MKNENMIVEKQPKELKFCRACRSADQNNQFLKSIQTIPSNQALVRITINFVGSIQAILNAITNPCHGYVKRTIF